MNKLTEWLGYDYKPDPGEIDWRVVEAVMRKVASDSGIPLEIEKRFAPRDWARPRATVAEYFEDYLEAKRRLWEGEDDEL